MMIKNNYIIIAAIFIFLMGSCDERFEEMNIDPNAVTADRMDLGTLLASAQLASTIRKDIDQEFIYMEPFVQHISSLGITLPGDKYVYDDGKDEKLWDNIYENLQKIEDLLYNIEKDNPEQVNLLAMTRIWRVLLYQRLTDTYGDVPYFEAGKGYYNGIVKPKYDKQEDIYYDMLKELDEAISQLDVDSPNFAENDIAYDGDIVKWKKMGNSLMLRTGMRLSNVAPDKAELWVRKAYQGGTFSSNEDNLFISGIDPTGSNLELINGSSYFMQQANTTEGQIAETFFKFLSEHNDPRLKHTVALYTDGTESSMNTDPALQKGLPNGYNSTTIQTHPSYDPDGFSGVFQYSTPNRNTYARMDGPRMLLTHAEVSFYLAEASIRGWIDGEAQEFYNKGVYSAMKMLSQYSQDAVINDDEIDEYLANNPFLKNYSEEEILEQINTQYWAATFMQGNDAWANIRRSGYPKLIPVEYPGADTGGGIGKLGDYPARLRYPEAEYIQNGDNYKEAVSRQGPDNFSTKVWWAK
ncbi:MAG: SusD/RagB family nutrient-binding outer membrane lipoprotein [Bacteroidales bacterium]